jgi:hypothetical protein
VLRLLPFEAINAVFAATRSLEYTHTQTFPAWIKKFAKLEYLYVLTNRE